MNDVLTDLGGGLLLRRATLDDVERLADYNARYLSDDGPEQPEEDLIYWTRDMMTISPSTSAGDFVYVEDSSSGQIVSSVCLISQTWCYEEIPFGVGRVEFVSTHPDYRRKGLIRSQFKLLHRWSKERGQKMQVITGIPYFYRQFGYEMTVNLGGGRQGYRPHVPKLKDGETEAYQFRPATVEDIPFLLEVYDHGRERSMLSCWRDEKVIRYEMQEQHDEIRGQMAIVESLEKEPLGFLWHPRKLYRSRLELWLYELKRGASWAAVTPAVIRYLKQKGEEYAAQEDEKQWEGYYFNFGPHHPSYEVAGNCLPEKQRPYAWYIRVADLKAFIEHISPVLNRRLAASAHAASYDGELSLNFHRSGLKLILENGQLAGVKRWQPSSENRGDLGFPPMAFLHLLCGYRSFEELADFYPDCYANEKPEAAALIDVLFPKKHSVISGIV